MSWRGTRSGRASRSPRAGALTARSSRRCSRPRPTRPRSSITPRRQAPRTSWRTTRSSRRVAPRRSTRTARRTRTTGRAADFVDRLPADEQAAVFEEFAVAAYARRAAGGRDSRRSSGRSRLPRARRRRRRRPLHAALPGCTGSPATVRHGATAREAIAILEPLGESVELAGAYSGSRAGDARGGQPRRRSSGGTARSSSRPARRREHARARARQHRERPVQLDPGNGDAARGPAVADAAGDRHEATRALVEPRLFADAVGAARAGAARAEQALAYAAGARGAPLAGYRATMARLAPPACGRVGRRPSGSCSGSSSRHSGRAALRKDRARRSWPSAAARRTRPSGSTSSRPGPTVRVSFQRIAPVARAGVERARPDGRRAAADERFEELVGVAAATEAWLDWGAARLVAWAASRESTWTSSRPAAGAKRRWSA